MYTANIQTMRTQNNNVAVSLHFLIFGIPGYDLLGPLTIIKRFAKQIFLNDQSCCFFYK